MAINAEEQYLGEIGQLEGGLAAYLVRGLGEGGKRTESKDGDGGGHRPGKVGGELASFGHSSRQPVAHRNSSGMKTISGPSTCLGTATQRTAPTGRSRRERQGA